MSASAGVQRAGNFPERLVLSEVFRRGIIIDTSGEMEGSRLRAVSFIQWVVIEDLPSAKMILGAEDTTENKTVKKTLAIMECSPWGLQTIN